MICKGENITDMKLIFTNPSEIIKIVTVRVRRNKEEEEKEWGWGEESEAGSSASGLSPPLSHRIAMAEVQGVALKSEPGGNPPAAVTYCDFE